MSGIDDNVGIIGEWVPPSPSSRAFFSGILGDDINSRTMPEPSRENKTEELFLGPQIQTIDGDSENNDMAHSGDSRFIDLASFPEQKSSSRGGLVERMAARAGFNAPRLNTAELSSSPDIRSPYLTIPPGLSPTTLLDSPVFLSNSLAQPSPTTGKFSFMPNSGIKNSILAASESADKSKDGFFDDISGSSFSFKHVPDSRSSFFLGTNKQSFPSIEVSVQSENSTRIAENSPPLEEQQDEGELRVNGTPSEDGYNWRKYGQKQVKGSEYPRSYYKCSQPNCPVKKKVERSHEGHITEIIYKGAHNHPKPAPNRRSAIGQVDVPDQVGIQSFVDVDSDPLWADAPKGTPNDNVEVSSNGQTQFESGDAVDASSTFSNDEDEDDRATHGSVGYEGEGDESESKRRKIESYPTDMGGATRAIREPRVVVQTTSEVDILDDGYRWRKYGQKVVKGNPNPRSYYKCTSAGCTVRKHVERASHDLKSVITTYEGKHNHEVPAARNSSHVNSGAPNNGNTQAGPHRPELAQVHNGMPRFERPGGYGRQPMGPTPGFSFGMNQPGLANLGMAGLGPGQPKMPVMPVHPYLGQQRQMNEMGFMVPKGEPKMEPMSEPGLGLPNGSSVYQQMMSRLPLGPQM